MLDSDGVSLHALFTWLERLPVATCGFALGLAGLASLWNILYSKYHSSWMLRVAYFCAVWSACWVALYLLKMLACRKAWLLDISKPSGAAAFGAWAPALSVLSSVLVWEDIQEREVARAGVWITAVLQLGNSFHFLTCCFRTHTPPEPFYYTAVQTVAMSAITGRAVDLQNWAQMMFLYVSLLLCVAQVPFVTWRLFKQHVPKNFQQGSTDTENSCKDGPVAIDLVANNPSVAIFVACPSITCAAYLSGEPDNPLGSTSSVWDPLRSAFIWFVIICLFLTLLALWERRSACFACSFSPAMAAYTFPFVITSVAIALFARDENDSRLDVLVIIITSVVSVLVVGLNFAFSLFMFSPIPWSNAAKSSLETQALGCEIISKGQPDAIQVELNTTI